ncbi:MAG: Octanoyltransferase [candidate division WS2 bacterium]|uniref:lipoyl(octanoyl) transferase n=1 Tax=Psychracetigena formicireducens TaxID=2986056 RepID=A0A9E2BI38_PSYF1|nr:Octanoyltransferase [Candidatus Psychracetigena formicireducens]
MEQLQLTARRYIFLLEEAIIRTVEHYGINAGRLEGATGVWLPPEKDKPFRKICSIGIKISRFVTMHGFAFNVNTNLDYFSYIHPCGFVDKGVISLKNEFGLEQNFEEVKQFLKNQLVEVFKLEII